MDSLRFLNDKELVEAYKKACKFTLSREFIEILREELLKRNKALRDVHNELTDSERIFK